MNINELLATHKQDIDKQVETAEGVVELLQDADLEIIVPDLLDAMASVGVEFATTATLGDTQVTRVSAAYMSSLLQKIEENA